MIRTTSNGKQVHIVDFTSAREIQATLLSRADVRKLAIDPGIMARWVQSVIAHAEKAGRLMTEKQLADHRAGRPFRLGDKVRFIGRTREEAVDGLDTPYKRPHDQTGIISNFRVDDVGKLFTFHPDGGKTDSVVDLVVREYTPGWLQLERIT